MHHRLVGVKVQSNTADGWYAFGIIKHLEQVLVVFNMKVRSGAEASLVVGTMQ